jgi:hypothetical protein
MDWVDNLVCRTCHEISGVIAVQQQQGNYGRVPFRTLLVAAAFFCANPAVAGVTQPDPLLHDSPQDACEAGADYVAGVDADGEPVVPADVGAGRVPIPDQVVVPLANRRRGQSGYVVLDGSKLEPLLNPKPCN